ncbi:putative pentatricopeptide repeat-containing protein At3g01580 [Telopea speciosissima]|uniref:putative pentatricopeptide repeat-containing protein At3g01580 n=1 Tax=Telopea speciosissima TaxID=54955 RepID=UPI001CC74E9E|nr:putative pentatricopeptide repeat-containing protein At3g01580 [Telopea speciosissima]
MKSRGLISPLFKACKDGKNVAQLHAYILKTGLIHDSFFATKISASYINYFSLSCAWKLFDETPHRSVYLWNSILRGYSREKQWNTTIHLFHQMLCSTNITATGNVKPDNFTISIALMACTKLSAIQMGRAIHGLVNKSEKIGLDMFVGSALIEFYVKHGGMDDALRVFDNFPRPDVVLWTSMVTGYQQSGNAEMAVSFFSRMVVMEGVNPDPVTLVSVVSAGAQLLNVEVGRCVHGFMIRMGFNAHLCLVNSILNLYAKTGSVNNARNLFMKMPQKDVISWSTMIAFYAQNAEATDSLDLFNEMIEKEVEPNSVTVVGALQACASACDLKEGRKIHEIAIQKGFELEVSVSTALVDMYMNCSCLEEAVDLFKRMPKKDVVSWAALIGGFAQNGLANKSIGIFCTMLYSKIRPDAVIMVKILTVSSELGNLHQALCLHGFLVSSGFDDRVFVGAALIKLYSKCGSIADAIKVFERMSERDVTVWSSMIAGYGIHGLGREALEIFDQLIETTLLRPNRVTFLSVLFACSHSGLVGEGIKIFEKMVHEYGINPSLEHYSVVVDLLGRTGELEKALQLIDQMPEPAGPHVWGALLGACRLHHNVKIGEIAAKSLLRLDPDHAGYYVLLCNIYAEDGKWHNAAAIRTLIKEKGLKKMPGYSSIDIGKELHPFLAV